MTAKDGAEQRATRAGVAMVTGAGGRIGAAMARRLAASGYAVIIHFRSSGDAAQSLVGAISNDGGSAAAVGADLADRGERAGLMARAAAAFGPVTLLVNNASVFERDSVADLDESLWDTHFALHVEAPVFLARDFAAQLPEGVTGNVVNIVDERVLHLTPAYFSYALSKAALLTATRTLAQSLAPRVRVNAIGPGPTMPHAGQTDEAFAQSLARLPLQRGATPEEIAEGLLYILGAPAMTGQMLALDGGRHIEWPERSGPTPRRK